MRGKVDRSVHSAARRDPSRRAARHRQDVARPRPRPSDGRVVPGRQVPAPRGRAAHADQFGDGQDAARGVGPLLAVDRRGRGRGPTIVLLDEVETLAADRSKMSLEANPIDIHRATDAVLVQLDRPRREASESAVRGDQQLPAGGRQRLHVALRPRLHVPLPDREACARILKDCLTGLGQDLSRRSASSPARRSSRSAPPNASASTGAPSARWSPTPSPAARRPR